MFASAFLIYSFVQRVKNMIFEFPADAVVDDDWAADGDQSLLPHIRRWRLLFTSQKIWLISQSLFWFNQK